MFTAQFVVRLAHDEIEEDNVWTSTQLEDFEAKGTEFNAHECHISLIKSGGAYKVSSSVCRDSLVDITFTRDTKGFKIGEKGTSLYGTDLSNPWGSMFHCFWPRCSVTGSLNVKGKRIELGGDSAKGMFVFAMQGMKPHHAAKAWNFTTVHGPTMSAVLMEFTTPPSYGCVKVGVAGVVRNGELLFTAKEATIKHEQCQVDEETGWSVPQHLVYDFEGPKITQSTDTPACTAHIEGDVGRMVQRVDVMAEIPAFVKKVVVGIAHAKPYVYQWSNKKLGMKITLEDGTVVEEDGHGWMEATFISE